MLDAGSIAASYCALATSLHLITTGLAVRRCRAGRRGNVPAPVAAPPVSIVRPVCGVDTFESTTLGSTFQLDYPDYEVLFCVASADDPVVPIVQSLIAKYPQVSARILVGNDLGSPNPKLNNVAKGWRAARHDWIILADSNVLMPSDCVQRLLETWRPDTGLVCSPPVGALPGGFGAEVECAFLNTYQARFQYAVDSVGYGFAQGKAMLWRRMQLDAAGGIRALAAEVAEDAAATKLVRRGGWRVRLVDRPFPQLLGARSPDAVWSRQVRWAQLRRHSFPAHFALEVLSGCLLPVIAGGLAAAAFKAPVIEVMVGLLALWLGAEAWLAKVAGWHLSWRSPFTWLVRDAAIPVLWLMGWFKRGYDWRGSSVSLVNGPTSGHVESAPT